MGGNILFATDLGMFSPYLLRKVIALAHQASFVVDVLHVVEPLGVFAESILETYLSDEEKLRLRRTGIDGVLQGIKIHVEDSVKAEFSGTIRLGMQPFLGEVIVERGDVAETICQQAVSRKAEFIIIGNHGQNSRQSNVVGAVAVKVLQLSLLPVLMIPIQTAVANNDLFSI